MPSEEPDHDKKAAWVANHPILAKAAQDGCLSPGTLEDLISAAGIALACTKAPVIVILSSAPIRNIKYHMPESPPRWTRDHPAKVMFEAAEHTAIGDSALLYFSKSDPGTLAYKVPLALPNGLSLSYGQIVALGGDFYGIPDAPISDGATQAERVTRFTDAYNSLATAPAAAAEAPKILAVMKTEIDTVKKALDAGQPASAAYKLLGDTLSAEWNKITGGGWLISPWIPPGRYLELSATNWDHFGQHAVLAYQAGHAAALTQALAARDQPTNQQQGALCWAYAMDAFACHFLSDVFSAGHIRAPRKELNDKVTPSKVGALLTRFMHDEDSHWGLNVTNPARSAWRAYGDKRYFDTVDLANKGLVDLAVQDSVDEVLHAFTNATVREPADYLALTRVANLTAAQNYSGALAAGNISPLFAWNGSAVLRRNDVENLNDYSWTGDWYGVTTLALLEIYNTNTPTGYPQPPTGSPAISSNGWQSTQSVLPNWIQGAQVHYAVSIVNNLYESDIGPWAAFTVVGANQAYPTLTVPVGPAGTVARRIYREFANKPCTYVGQIADNTTTTFIDNTR
jgi:hypothetical protein